jgi:predicted MFS family arabinose efflux permease
VAQIAMLVAAVDLVILGWVWTSDLALIPFAVVFSGCSTIVYVTMTIATLESLPEAPGAAMSLQAAVFQLGGAIGIAFAGVMLTWLDDYVAVYRMLGIMLPLGALFVWRASRIPAPVSDAAPVSPH